MARQLDHSPGQTMSFGDHLEELRKRIILAVVAPIPLAIIAYFFTDTLIEVLLLPLTSALAAHGLPQQVSLLSPVEMVITQLKLSIITAAIIAAPWMLWQAWLFISPGLYRHEKRFVHLLMPGSAVLTVAGVLLLYYVMLPVMLHVMVGIGANVKLRGTSPTVDPRVEAALQLQQPIRVLSEAPRIPSVGEKWLVWPDMGRAYIAAANADGTVVVLPLPAAPTATISQQFRLSEYIGFVLVLAVGTVIGFQMPLVVMLLGWIGVASPHWFRQQRRYALFGCAAAAAIITPSSDLISMLVLMLPLYALYELGILLLLIAPASKVAEGRVFSLPRWSWRRRERSDKQSPAPEQTSRSAQTDSLDVPGPADAEKLNDPADREEVSR